YTGEMYDSSASMYYLRARWYDQQTGRFNRMDPFAGNTHDPQSLHKYLYVHNNPINNYDPSGLFSISTAITTVTYVSLAIAIIPHAIRGLSAAKSILELTDLTNLVRRLANRGVIDFITAEAIRSEAFFTFTELLAIVGNSVAMIAKEVALHYGYNLAFAAVTQAAVGGLKTSVKFAKGAIATRIGGEVVENHHLVFASSLKKGLKSLKANMFKLPRRIHRLRTNGIHSRIAASDFAYLQPGGAKTMSGILEDVGRQQWLDDLGKCYKWLETEFSGDYKGIHKAYQNAVKAIDGTSGLI
ncbi:MAG: RHS repeat-associated core domain-containing protein, partial [Candidatus Thorarchaeota archaeon]